ncbi:MAG TPA: RDD family protein [Bacteroidia bacterium]|nr:RDD family protein [Bacteroidia bacterium]HNS13151.1 RDD family protein [Bacteroidia bacterium]
MESHNIDIQSENRVEYAGFWLRFGAHILDQLILGFFSFLVIMPILVFTGMFAGLSALANLDVDDMSDAESLMIIGGFMGFVITMSLISLVVSWLYYAIMESSPRQATLGKIALEIKVTDMSGNRLTFLNATGRYFGKIISGMTFTIGYIMAGFTTRKQALHDIIAGCLVVKKNI